MNETVNIETKIIDEKKTFFVKVDTEKNALSIYSNYDEPKFDYHIETYSSLLSDIIDYLRDVEVDGKVITGSAALMLTRECRFEDIIRGIIRSIGKKNLFLTVTGLFGKFKKKAKTDIPLNDMVKLIMSETVNPDSWTIEIN